MSSISIDDIVKMGEALDRAAKPKFISETRIFIEDLSYPTYQYRFLKSKSKSKVKSKNVKVRKILRWDKLIPDGQILISELEGKVFMNSTTRSALDNEMKKKEAYSSSPFNRSPHLL